MSEKGYTRGEFLQMAVALVGGALIPAGCSDCTGPPEREGQKTLEPLRRETSDRSQAATREPSQSPEGARPPDLTPPEPSAAPQQTPEEIAAAEREKVRRETWERIEKEQEAKEINPAKVAEIAAKIAKVKTHLKGFRPRKNPDGTFTPETRAQILTIVSTALGKDRKTLQISETDDGLNIFDTPAPGQYVGSLLFSLSYYGPDHDDPTITLGGTGATSHETLRLNANGSLKRHEKRERSTAGDHEDFYAYGRGSHTIHHLVETSKDFSFSAEYEVLIGPDGKPFMARIIGPYGRIESFFIDKKSRDAYKRGDFNNANWGPNTKTDHFAIGDEIHREERKVDQKKDEERLAKDADQTRKEEGVDRVVNPIKVGGTETELKQFPTFLDKLKIEFKGDRLTAESKAQLKEVLAQAFNCQPRDLRVLDNMGWVDRKKEKYVDIMLKGHPAATVVFNKATGELEIEIGSIMATAENPFIERLDFNRDGKIKTHLQERWENGEITQFKKTDRKASLKTISGDRKRVLSGKEIGYEDYDEESAKSAAYAVIKDRDGKFGIFFKDDSAKRVFTYSRMKADMDSTW